MTLVHFTIFCAKKVVSYSELATQRGGDGGALRFALGLLALCAGAATRRRCPAAKNADAVAFFMRLREKL